MSLRLAQVTVLVLDYTPAIDYFTRVLGFTLVENTPLSGDKRWILVAPPGGGTGVILARAATPEQRAQVGHQAGGRVAFFLHTDDFAGDVAVLAGRGVAFDEPPRMEPYGMVAVFRDLYGNRWDLVERPVQ